MKKFKDIITEEKLKELINKENEVIPEVLTKASNKVLRLLGVILYERFLRTSLKFSPKEFKKLVETLERISKDL